MASVGVVERRAPRATTASATARPILPVRSFTMMGTAAAMAVARRAERGATGRVARRNARDAIGFARLDASAGVRIVAGKDATGDMSNERRTGVRARDVSLRRFANTHINRRPNWQLKSGTRIKKRERALSKGVA